MFREALTFDDVLLQPAESNVLPSQADTKPKSQKQYRLVFPCFLPRWIQ